MFEELCCLELSGKKYPIKCDLLVLERIQEEFGSIREFEKSILTWEPLIDENGNEVKDELGEIKTRAKFPQVKAVNSALFWMVTEGEAIAAQDEGRQIKEFDRDFILRKADIPLSDLAGRLHGEFFRCFKVKNAGTTQREETKSGK